MYSPGLSLSRHRRRFLNLFTVFALLIAMLPVGGVSTTSASTTELFFSEYIEGTSNNKALEIYNDTGAAINLGTLGYNVQMFFNGSASPGLTINLVGTVADDDVFVLAHGSAVAAILDQADQTSSASWFNGDDAVVLRKGTAIIDSLGQVGFDPGTEWGTGLTSTADNTLRRKPTVLSGDTNGTDVFDPSVEWDGFATDTFGGLGSHVGGETAPTVSSTDPSSGAVNVALNSNITVTFSEPVNIAGAWFTISCATSGSHTATVSGGPTAFTLNPDSDFANLESCTVTITATQVSDQDAVDPPDNMAANHAWSFTTIGNPCDDPFTPIYSIQGSGDSAAITGNVTTEGVVVGDFEGGAGLQGFYMQDVSGDSDPTTSDGIFVFTGNVDTVSLGQYVRVTGYARERFNMTALNGSNSNGAPVPAANIISCGSGSVVATDVTMPAASATYLERYEGMLVRLPQALQISEYFNFERFGEIVLALPLNGEPRAFTPTGIVEPGAPAIARAQANSLSRITLDDGLSVQNPDNVRHPNGGNFALTNRFRGGDTVQNTVGVLSFDFNLYRIQPTGPADYTAVNPRPEAPQQFSGSLRVAAMNTLNFFLTLDYPSGHALDNKCGPGQNVECRGADFDQPTEFTRQRDKLLPALVGLNADVLGLNEIENTTGVDPLGDPTNGIVPGLNARMGAGTYASIDTGVIGTDAIRVGLIYKPAKVTPVGNFELLTSEVDPRFIDTRSRPALAQTFEEVATGARFTVVVNHLKSKGSACAGDPDTGDGQGNCNGTRTLAAQALVDWLATDPTGSGDTDFLIMGDLNSYAMEDPIDAIKAGADDTAGTADDWTNLISQYQGPHAHSYVFDGQAGYLDHAMASASLTAQVTGAADWHINSDEADLLDYDTSFKPPAQEAIYEPNAYRSSDHDPVVIGMNLNAAPVAVDDAMFVPKNGSETIVALANDYDGNGDTLTVTGFTQGTNGTVKYSLRNNNFRYTPRKGFRGTDTFTYTISDGRGGTDTATVTVTVR